MAAHEELKSIQIYYDEASRFDLLTKEQEIELFKTMHKWTYNKSNCGSSARKKGAEAREKLINSNLRLVIKIAKEFIGAGLDLPDLINEGNTGLIKGVDKFKLGKGAKLSHYGSFWIRQCIMRALANHGRTIRLPQGAVQQKINIIKFKNDFHIKNGRHPSYKEIAKGLKLSLDRVVLLSESSLTVASLNAPVGKNQSLEDESVEMGDLLADEKSRVPDEVAQINNDNALLYSCLEKLDNRERYIIEKRFALTDQKPETLEVIGERFGVTRERIRQVESQAMNKLKFLLANKMK
jgi:RNA polymerase sigma factor (sigma-70 family)